MLQLLHAALRKKVPDINPYIVNWVIDFLKDRQQKGMCRQSHGPILACTFFHHG